jgi:hypothetical protein
MPCIRPPSGSAAWFPSRIARRRRVKAVVGQRRAMAQTRLSRDFSCLFLFVALTSSPLGGFAQSENDCDALSYWNFEKFIYQGWRFGKTRAEIVKRLGTPLQTKIEKLENRYTPGQMDEIYHLFYDGVYVRIYKVSEVPEREFLTDVTVTSSRYNMAQGLKVGDTKQRVTKLLGCKYQALRRPDLRVEVPELEKDCAEENNACTLEYTDSRSHVYFSFKQNKVARIDWVFWGE